jgi:histidinol-phosphate phosphatase family protein
MLPVAILAGGLATRLRPITEKIPKALIDINGQPFLAHQLRLLKAGGAQRIVLCVGYRGEMIRDFAGDGSRFGLSIEYSFDGEKLLGTGGALRRALPLLGEAFFVLYGDSYLPCDYQAVERTFRESGKLGLMTVFRNGGQYDTSNIEFAGGRILRYEKVNRTTAMGHIDYGLGALRAEVIEALPAGEIRDLASVYQDLLRRQELAAFEVPERFYEIGSTLGIRELEAYLAARKGRAVFLDRDGVLNEAILRDGKPYAPATPAEVRIIPGAADAIRRLKEAGFELIVVTNQPDVARGTLTRETVDEMNALVAAAMPVDAFYVCAHDGKDDCACRKPQPGLLLNAAQERNIDLSRSYMVGDRWRDVDAGAAAGCRTVWMDYGYDERGPEHAADYRTKSLGEAVEWILGGGDDRPAAP